MNPLLSFYRGTAPDDRGRTLADVLAFADDHLEGMHDFIQWLFPLPERSSYNPSAPLLDAATIDAFNADISLRAAMLGAYRRMLAFYGLEECGGTVVKAENWDARTSHWFTSPSHNDLRVTRILRSMSLLGLQTEAQAFLSALLGLARTEPTCDLDDDTLSHWRAALADTGELENRIPSKRDRLFLNAQSLQDIAGMQALEEFNRRQVSQDYLSEQIQQLTGSAAVRAIQKQANQAHEAARQFYDASVIRGEASALTRAITEYSNSNLVGVDTNAFRQIADQLAASAHVPDVLKDYQIAQDVLAERIKDFGQLDQWSAIAVEAFAATSAMRAVFDDAVKIGDRELELIRGYVQVEIPRFDTPGMYDRFLDAAGLSAPLPVHLEHRGSFDLPELGEDEDEDNHDSNLPERSEIQPVTAELLGAFELTYFHESVLRQEINIAMSRRYGNKWAKARLRMCGCSALFGKWQRRGGDPLNHADFADYARIISDPEHFAEVFSAGYGAADFIADRIHMLRKLRADSQHPGHTFGAEALRDMRITWGIILVGFTAINPGFPLRWSLSETQQQGQNSSSAKPLHIPVQSTPKPEEIFTIKPTFMGMSIDMKALARRLFRRKWRD